MSIGNTAEWLCKNHPEVEAGEMWPWKKSDRLCMPCIYDSQAAAETLIDRDLARPYPAPRMLEFERSTDGRLIGSEYARDKEEPKK